MAINRLNNVYPGYEVIDQSMDLIPTCVMCHVPRPASFIALETNEALCIHHKLCNDEARRKK